MKTRKTNPNLVLKKNAVEGEIVYLLDPIVFSNRTNKIIGGTITKYEFGYIDYKDRVWLFRLDENGKVDNAKPKKRLGNLGDLAKAGLLSRSVEDVEKVLVEQKVTVRKDKLRSLNKEISKLIDIEAKLIQDLIDLAEGIV